MFGKIPQFFLLSFFRKIALPNQVYVLEISQTFRSCAFIESFLASISESFSWDNNFKLLSKYPKTIARKMLFS